MRPSRAPRQSLREASINSHGGTTSRRLVLQSVRLVAFYAAGRGCDCPLRAASSRAFRRASSCTTLAGRGTALGRAETRTRWRYISASSLSRRALTGALVLRGRSERAVERGRRSSSRLRPAEARDACREPSDATSHLLSHQAGGSGRLSRPPAAERCCLCHSPTLRPWIIDCCSRASAALSTSYVEGF